MADYDATHAAREEVISQHEFRVQISEANQKTVELSAIFIKQIQEDAVHIYKLLVLVEALKGDIEKNKDIYQEKLGDLRQELNESDTKLQAVMQHIQDENDKKNKVKRSVINKRNKR